MSKIKRIGNVFLKHDKSKTRSWWLKSSLDEAKYHKIISFERVEPPAGFDVPIAAYAFFIGRHRFSIAWIKRAITRLNLKPIAVTASITHSTYILRQRVITNAHTVLTCGSAGSVQPSQT